MENVIKTIESKGYIVKATENRCMGKLDESCPVVYEILKPDYSEVYGANGLSFKSLSNWLDLPDLNTAKKAVIAKPFGAEKEAERKIKERKWDNLYNEGTGGYNPYRV